jgi:hypothetical protein
MTQKQDKDTVFASMDWKVYAITFALFVIEFIVLVWMPWMYGVPLTLSESGPIFLILAAITFLFYIYMQDRRMRRARRD